MLGRSPVRAAISTRPELALAGERLEDLEAARDRLHERPGSGRRHGVSLALFRDTERRLLATGTVRLPPA